MAATLLADVANAGRRGSARGALAAAATLAQSAGDAGLDEATTDALAAALVVERGLGDQAAAAASHVATGAGGSARKALSPGATRGVAAALAGALGDVRRRGTRPQGAAGDAMAAMGALAAGAAAGGASATANASTAAADVMAVADAAAIAMVVGAADGETREVAAGSGSSLACSRGASGAGSAGVASTSGAGLAFSAPPPTPADGSSSADLCAATVAGNPYAAADPNTTLGSPLVSLNLRSSGGADVAVRGTPMTIRLPLDAAAASAAAAGTLTATCGFYNTTLGAFDGRGCREVGRSETALECECDHLTDFGVTVNAVEVGNFADAKVSTIAYVAALSGLLVLLLPIAYVTDQWRQRKHIDATREHAASVAGAIAAAEAAAASPLDPLAITARPPVQRSGRPESLRGHFVRTLLTDHPWLAPFGAHPTSNFTAPQRLLVLFVVVVTQLFATGLMFDPDKPSVADTVAQTVAGAAVSVPLALVASLVVGFFFRFGPRTPFDAKHTYAPHGNDTVAEEQEAETAAVMVDAGSCSSSPPSLTKKSQQLASSSSPMHPLADAAAVVVRPCPRTLAARSAARTPSPTAFRRGTTATDRGAAVTKRGLAVTRAEVAALADSFASHGRHIAAITLHTVAAASAVRTELEESSTTAVSQASYVAAALAALGYPAVDGARWSRHTLQPRSAHPRALLSVVMEAYLGAPLPTPDAQFPLAEGELAEQTTEELYGDEMHGCVWRLAIECVKERQLSLAEALFTMHLLLEAPDLYLVLFDAPAPETFDEVLATVCAVAAPMTSGTDTDSSNAGRLWASTYAARLLYLDDAAAYDEAHVASEAATPEIVSALLGLHETRAPVVQNGCVPYSLGIELDAQAPALAEVPGLAPAGQSVPAGTFVSAVVQAHALRLTPKPFVDQRWMPSTSDRIALARASARDPAPSAVAEASAESTADCRRALHRGESLVASRTTPPHALPLSAVLEALTTSTGLRARKPERAMASRFAYSSVPRKADLGATGAVLRKLDSDVYARLAARDTAHGNFYATIECGRLMAMLHAVRTQRHTMQTFARQYIGECAALSELKVRGLRAQAALSSWLQAAGNGPRDASQELIGSNLAAARSGPAGDAALHRLVNAAAISGRLTLAPCSPVAAAAIEAPRSRVTAPEADVSAFPLTRLCRYHAPTDAGCGTLTTPHVGITSAVRAARVGERIELVAGTYPPAQLAHINATSAQPLHVSPVGYAAAVRAIAADASVGLSSHDPFDVAATVRAPDAFRQALAAVAQRKLTAEERERFAKCIVTHPIAFGGQAAGGATPLLTLRKCAHLRFEGLHFRRAALAVDAANPDDVELRHCVVACDTPFASSSGGDSLVPEHCNDVHAATSRLRRALLAGDLPWGVVFVGYVLFAGVYVLFAFMCLFVSAGFSDAQANEWAARTAVATAAVALIVQPVTAGGAASFSFANSVVLSALAELRALVPQV